MKAENRIETVKTLIFEKTHLMDLSIEVTLEADDKMLVEIKSCTQRQLNSVRNIMNTYGLNHIRARAITIIEETKRQRR